MARRIIVAAILISFLVAACTTQQTPPAQTQQPTPTPGGEVTPSPSPAVQDATVTVLTPSFGTERFDYTFAVGAESDYAFLLHCLLVSSEVVNGQRRLAPGVASAWEPSADGRTWAFTIRDGVKFHDGSDVTAEDVTWTLQHAIGPEAAEWAVSGAQSLALEMERIEQTGPSEVSVTTKSPIYDLPVTLSDAGGQWIGILPKRDSLRNEQAEAAYDQDPVGCGPFRLVGHVPGSEMKFERFDDYYHQPSNGFTDDRRPKFTKLDLKLVPEEATRVAALQTGEADIALASLSARPQLEGAGGRLVFGSEGVSFEAQGFGCWTPGLPCNKKEVRQALAYAINKEAIQALYGPEVMQPKGWFAVSPSTIGYSPELDPYPFDPDKARGLLSDAGYPNGAGFGKVIINTWESTAIPLQPESALLAAEDWKRELGLDVEVNAGDEGAIKEAYKTTEDLFGQYIWKDQEPKFDASVNLRQAYGTIKEDKLSRAHSDPALAAYVADVISVADPDQRALALNEAYRRVVDEAYHIGIGYLNIPWGVGPRIATWEPYPFAIYVSAIHTITLK